MRVSIVVALLLTGCFSPSYKSHDLRCEVGTHNCPDGYHCGGDDRCWKNGTDPTLDMRPPQAVLDMAPPPTPDLAPTGRTNGATCKLDGDCASTHCVDGVCCDKACTGQCEACDGNTPGTCAAVQGPPHSGRPACNGGGGSCGGMCDGKTTAQCTYPPTTQVCGAACDSHCDGNGSCPGGTGSCPNGFACGSGMCKTSCTNNNDCQTNFACMAPSCVRIPESDCLDGLDNNGDGKIDCDDPTCTTVECVRAPGNGNEVGFLNSTCTAAGYTVTEAANQNLSADSCTGCTCKSSVYCHEHVVLYSTATSGSPICSGDNEDIDMPVLQAGASGFCTAITAIQTHSYFIMPQTVYNVAPYLSGCFLSGSPTVAKSHFQTPNNFCAAARTSTNNCAGDSTKICVAKPPASTKLCARVPGMGATCPAGYGATSDTYYAGINQGTCGSCGGCSGTPTCSGISPIYASTDSSCNGYGFASPNNDGSACSLDQIGNPAPTIASIAANLVQGASISCSAATVTTNYATPTGPSTICCP